MPPDDGWPGLFAAAFRQSKNPMVLVDDRRTIVDANGSFIMLLGHQRKELIDHRIFEFVDGGPLLSESAWDAALDAGRFTGEALLLCAAGGTVAVQWGATTEVVTGRRLVLVVALTTSRWGSRFRPEPSPASRELSPRQREIVRLVAHGMTGQEIADELVIAHETVRTHIRSAMGRLGARSRAHLVAKALGEGHV
jgi:DNA-binding CsgD family transcriptional regulator